jgi:hypothetical protein
MTAYYFADVAQELMKKLRGRKKRRKKRFLHLETPSSLIPGHQEIGENSLGRNDPFPG